MQSSPQTHTSAVMSKLIAVLTTLLILKPNICLWPLPKADGEFGHAVTTINTYKLHFLSCVFFEKIKRSITD